MVRDKAGADGDPDKNASNSTSMEAFVLNILHAAAWLFLFIFLFAVIGLVATVRWIMALVTGTERAVTTGVQNVEHSLHHRD